MSDCHVDTYAVDGIDAEHWRAVVIHTPSGRQIYVTWPYRSERAAINRARRWIREEYGKAERMELFE